MVDDGYPLGGKVPGEGEKFIAALEQARERDAEYAASLAGQPFVTKDSGSRAEYASGMVRDTEEGKARFDLLLPLGVPYEAQMLTRFAELMARGAKKYEARNWEKANGQEELDRYRSSALRHLAQWAANMGDEDHAAAVMFNLMAGETVKWKMSQPKAEEQPAQRDPAMEMLVSAVDTIARKALRLCARCGNREGDRRHWPLMDCDRDLGALYPRPGPCPVPNTHHPFLVDFEVC